MISDERGQGSVEILFLILILALLFFGGIELSQGVLLKHALDVGTEKAARLLSVNPADYGVAEDLIRDEVDGNLLGRGYGDRVTVGLYDADTMASIAPSDLAAAGFSYRFVVRTEVPWEVSVPFLPLGTKMMTVEHQGLVERFP